MSARNFGLGANKARARVSSRIGLDGQVSGARPLAIIYINPLNQDK